MKAVIINHSDSRGGASVVSMRLMKALADKNVDISMLTVHKAGADPAVVTAAPGWRAKLPFLAEHARIFAANGFTRRDLFAASIATDGLPLSRHPLVREADAVLLNWVNQGMLSLAEIARIAAAGKKIVWTMHDMWNATGICHHAGTCTRFTLTPGCGNCPLLHGAASDADLSRSTWLRKKVLYDCTNIRFVAVSSWLAEKCRESSLLSGKDVTVIPNAFPVDEFYTEPRRSRAEIGLPEGKKLIVMGAARLDDPVKGLPLAIEALNRLADSGETDAHAVFFGAVRNPDALAGLRLSHTVLGPVSDSSLLREIYAHATAVLSSSLYETLPGTLIEGQAAGAYPVSFGNGGQRDIIDSPATGYIARSYDTADLAAGLRRALDGDFNPALLRDSVSHRFSASAVADRYLSLLGARYEGRQWYLHEKN